MGLFGGFKAKFTKDSTTKNAKKSAKKNDVVCVGYRVFSEFHDPPQYLPPEEPSARKRPPAIKTIPVRPDSGQNGLNHLGPPKTVPTETRIITNPTVRRSLNRKPSNLSPAPVSQPLSSSIETVNISTNIPVQLRNKENGTSKSAPNSVYVVGKTSSFNPLAKGSNTSIYDSTKAELRKKEAPKSILKSKSAVDVTEFTSSIGDSNSNYTVTSTNGYDSDPDDDKSLVTSAKMFTKAKGYQTESVDYLSATQSTNKNYNTQVATYVVTGVKVNESKISNTTNTSTTYSGGSSYSQTSRSLGNTSSHAANIFFGGDEEPEVQRPRRVNLGISQNDEERRSSADC